MLLSNYYHFLLIILSVHVKHLLANQCYQCTEFFNYTLTTDNLATTNTSSCSNETALKNCFARITWFEDGKSEILYGADANLPIDSVSIFTNRRVITWSGDYNTRRYLMFTCQASNTTPCNTFETLKNVLASTTFPTDEQIQKFDGLIAPTTDFYGNSCFNSTNATDCPSSNLASCQQCMGILEHSNQLTVCAMCPPGKALANFFDYTTTYSLNNQTRSDSVKLGCRKHGGCNSFENLAKIKNTLSSQFDFAKFSHSTTLFPHFSLILSFVLFAILNAYH